ncbi:MAG TPA: biopolymer transporter ExbD [Myxococcota bacterium]|jgi:biopolymer transport protein ExbD
MDFRGARKNRRLQIELNVTSFVDIIFNLLVFFILSTSFTTGATSAGLVVQLPSAAHADAKIAAHDIVIALTKEGETVVQGHDVGVDELPGLLEQWKKQEPDGMVIIQADSEVIHGRVVEVMDKVKQQGIARVVIAAQGD